jgi:hypothetical protein
MFLLHPNRAHTSHFFIPLPYRPAAHQSLSPRPHPYLSFLSPLFSIPLLLCCPHPLLLCRPPLRAGDGGGATTPAAALPREIRVSKRATTASATPGSDDDDDDGMLAKAPAPPLLRNGGRCHRGERWRERERRVADVPSSLPTAPPCRQYVGGPIHGHGGRGSSG